MRVGSAEGIALLLLGLSGHACSSDAPRGGPTNGAGPGGRVSLDEDASAADGKTPGGPAVHWVGRFDTRDPDGPRVGWPGARILYRFDGTGLTVRVTEDCDSVPPDPSRYDVIIDGVTSATPLVPAKGPGDYVVASGLPKGVHVVELWRRTDSSIGITQFRGFEVADGELLAPPPAPGKRIEFIGDSASNGYGVECTGPSESFSGATQNERKAYPALIAQALGAEHHNLSFGGKGVTRNITAADRDMFTSLYLRALPEDAASTWAFGSWVPDVVWIGLAGNDFDLGDPPRAAPDLALFKEKYHALVSLVRAKNPSARILCTVAASLNDYYPAGYDAYTNVTAILKAVVAERHRAPYEDPKVDYFELPRADSSGPNGAPDLTACDYHSNAAFHQKIATAAAAKIEAITGW